MVRSAPVKGRAPTFMPQKKSEARPSSRENVEQLLTLMERDWTAATYKRDAATLDRIIADDWVAFTWDAETVGKAQVMADANSGANTNTAVSIILQDMKACVFGNAAVLTGRKTERGQHQGRDMSGHYLWTDVLVKRNGRWQAVARQTTRVGEPKSQNHP